MYTLDVKANYFIEGIKSGQRVKAGSKWLRTHVGLTANAALPAKYLGRIQHIMGLLAAAEVAKPTAPGRSMLLNIEHPKGRLGATFKWLGKDNQGKRIGLFGVEIDDLRFLTVDLSTLPPSGFWHEGSSIAKVEVPQQLHALFQEALARTPNKFIGEEAVLPSSGVTDERIFQMGKKAIVGVDDAGRGSWAGPLIVGAVLITPESRLPDVFDSKQLDRGARQDIFRKIQESGITISWAVIERKELDAIGVSAANAKAIQQAFEACNAPTAELLVDGSPQPLPLPATFLTKGESTSKAIAAASIIATAIHEQCMLKLHDTFPAWDFKTNLGYGTPAHLELLKQLGPSPAHRMSYKPMKDLFPDPGQLTIDMV